MSLSTTLQELKGIKGRSQGLAWAKQAAFLFCQVLPHALVTASAIGQRHNFAALVTPPPLCIYLHASPSRLTCLSDRQMGTNLTSVPLDMQRR